MEQGNHGLISSQRAGHSEVQPLRSGQRLSIGIDIGSTSSDVVVLDGEDKVVFSSYRRTMGRPIETFRGQLAEALAQINAGEVEVIAATGSAARLAARQLGIPFVNEVAAQAAAISHLYPSMQEATVIEMGGQDSKLIFLRREQGATE